MFIITRKNNGQYIAAIDAPETVPAIDVFEKFKSYYGISPDNNELNIEVCRHIDWFGNLQNIDTPFCDLANTFFVRNSPDLKTGSTLSGPHKERPQIEPGQFLFQKDKNGVFCYIVEEETEKETEKENVCYALFETLVSCFM